MLNKKILQVKTSQGAQGINVSLRGKNYKIEYPKKIWQKTPAALRSFLLDNLAFAETHWLPVMLNEKKIAYNTALPLLEPFLFKNQLYDMLYCEKADSAPHLSYLKRFYNTEFVFNGQKTSLPDWPVKKNQATTTTAPTAILPFTFGKESLATLALCLELGIKPILFYCQEPSQSYEQKYKLKKLKELKARFNIDSVFVKHEPGLFRYGKAFKLRKVSDLGWGTQISLLALLSLPFVLASRASYVLVGNEYLNNEMWFKNGWKVFPSFDQTSQMTSGQNTMFSALTAGQCGVKSSLEPLEEIHIFYLLHRRYPELGKYQFSCSAEEPLAKGSAWCHACYKCARIYLFARALGFDPAALGFKENLLDKMDLWKHYFGSKVKTGAVIELDFSFYILYFKGDQSAAVKVFAKLKKPLIKPWLWYYRHFDRLKSDGNLPSEFRVKMRKIFDRELSNFKKLIAGYAKVK
ncbi:MAG: hypothetical protein Q8P32_00105 [Candidatus Komeilibacteria bacterium]|nr:hypothetical protein [Candidatus Komeilibacteria bacterium]